MTAEITYNAGLSYRLKNYRFRQGIMLVVTDPAVIQRCQETAGFSVRLIKTVVKPKVKVAAPVASTSGKKKIKKVVKSRTDG